MDDGGEPVTPRSGHWTVAPEVWSVVCVYAGGRKTCLLVEASDEAVARIVAFTRLGETGLVGLFDMSATRVGP